MEAEYVDGFIRIYATFILPKNLGTTVNQVWQVGEYGMGGVLAKHKFDSANMISMGKIDLVKGERIIMGRYLRTYESLYPAWFNFHVSCQVIGYIVGVSGWGSGMKLGYESKEIEYGLHRIYGVALFSLCTMQVFALSLRPKKVHKYRKLWKFFHHTEGYVIVILGIVNMFKGLSILNPASKWINSYTLLLYILLGIAIFAEVVTWIVYCKKRLPRPTNR
ncbi:hypothetical protein MKX01_028943 [Papaver californicum]|nr:hypothetical protein MKX01_028943 [Papaver californicum]